MPREPQEETLGKRAHELRGSLAALRNIAHLLESPDLDAARLSRARDIMNRQIQNMARQIDELLDAAGVARVDPPAPDDARPSRGDGGE